MLAFANVVVYNYQYMLDPKVRNEYVLQTFPDIPLPTLLYTGLQINICQVLPHQQMELRIICTSSGKHSNLLDTFHHHLTRRGNSRALSPKKQLRQVHDEGAGINKSARAPGFGSCGSWSDNCCLGPCDSSLGST